MEIVIHTKLMRKPGTEIKSMRLKAVDGKTVEKMG